MGSLYYQNKIFCNVDLPSKFPTHQARHAESHPLDGVDLCQSGIPF